MPEDVDSQRDGLQEEARIEVLVPEHQEKSDRVEVAHPEIVFVVAAREENAGKAEYRSDQVDQKYRTVSRKCKQSIVNPIHVHSVLS